MSKYQELLLNKPKLTVKEGAREVIFKTISCMCDNVGYLRFKKNLEGDFKLDGMGYAISNWQMKANTHELEWLADEGAWEKVIGLINTGTSQIESVKSR
jgi:hypothetical protein